MKAKLESHLPLPTSEFDRRTALVLTLAGILGALQTTTALALDDADCKRLQAALDSVATELGRIDEWVANDGPSYLASLRNDLDNVLSETRTADVLADTARLETLVAVLEGVIGVIILLLGFPEIATVGLIFAVAALVSKNLIFIKAATVPSSIGGFDVAELTVDSAGMALKNYPEGSLGFAARGTFEVAGKALSYIGVIWSFVEAYNSAAEQAIQEEKLLALNEKADELKASLTDLDQPGNLYAFREDQLNALREQLVNTFAAYCPVVVPNP